MSRYGYDRESYGRSYDRNRYESEKKFWRPFKILKTVALVMSAAALVLVLLAVYTVRENTAEPTAGSGEAASGTGSGNGQLKLAEDQDSQENVRDKINQSMEADTEPGIEIDCRTEIYATAGQTLLQNINLTNSAKNTDYYMTYELWLPDDSEQGYEVLFKTDLITAGNAIQNVELSRALEAGSYECTMLAQPYYVSDRTPTNNLLTSVTLIVS